MRRHPAFAFIAGIAFPGLGLWVVGRPLLAAITLVLSLASVVAVPVLVLDGTLGVDAARLPALLRASTAALWLPTAFVAAVFAWRDGERARKPLEHLWWTAGFVMLGIIARMSLNDRVVAASLFHFDVVTTSALQPAIARGTPVLIVKRAFEPARAATGQLVALRKHDDDTPMGRIVAIEGQSVAIDDGRLVVDGVRASEEPCTPPPPGAPPLEGPCVVERLPSGVAYEVTSSTPARRVRAAETVGPGMVFVAPDDRSASLDVVVGPVRRVDLDGLVVTPGAARR